MSNQSNQSAEWADEIVKRHKDRVFRTAIAIMGNMTDAEDISQDVFIKLLEKQPDFASTSHETAWLMKVTVNLCKDRLRSFFRRKTEPLPETHPAQNNEQQELIEIVNLLPYKYKIVIHLYYYEGFSTYEIAEMTKQNNSTVRSQLARARKSLKKFLEGEDD